MDEQAHKSTDTARRVGLVTWSFPKGSEGFIYELADLLSGSGLDVALLPVHGADGADDPDLGRLSRVRDLVRMPPRLDRIGAVGRALARPWELRVDLARPRHWPDTVRSARLFEGVGLLDVTHLQFATLGEIALRQMDLGSMRTRALVVHLRGYDISSHVRACGPRVYDRLFARADLFIANCEHFRQVAIGLGCPGEKIVVIGSPCDTGYFVPPEEPRTPPRDRPLRLVAVGRLVEKKGFADAVEAMGLLAGRGRDVTLDILGDGPERGDLEARAARSGAGERVRFHGAADRARVRAALHHADIGLAPSVTASTGDQDAPVNTLKEQMAAGLPVIATWHGGIPELVIDGENGRLVPERDPAAIAAAIDELAGVPERWSTLGAAGRQKVVETYSRPVILEKTRAAYARAIGHGKQGT